MKPTPPGWSCPSGTSHGLLVDFALGDLEGVVRGEVRGHAGACRTCALELARILVAVGPPHHRWCAASGDPGRGPVLRFTSPPLRGIAVAAVLLVVATLSAIGGLRIFRRPVFVTSSPDPDRPVAEAAAKTGLRFEEAGLSGDSLLLASVRFLRSSSSMGTVALVRSSPSRRLDLCGFDEHGDCLWVASRDWPTGEWESTLGSTSLTFPPLGMKSIVTRHAGDRLEETIAITLHGARRSALLLVDPASGLRRGVHFHEGVLRADQNSDVLGMGTLPAKEGEARKVLLGGDHGSKEGPRPCLTVLDPSGRGIQHVLLPMLPRKLGIGDALRDGVDDLRIDWGPDETGLVQAITSDLLIARIPWRGGRLVLAEATIEIADGAKAAYNNRQGDPKAFETLMKGEGGEEAFARRLLREIEETPPTFPSGWEDR